MNKHRATLANLILDVGADLADKLRDMPPSKATDRGPEWHEYLKLKNLHKALVEALEHST